jgi:hypothetical protein
MAEVTSTRVLPPEFIEAAGKTFLSDLATATGQFKTADLSKAYGPQFVAPQDALQTQAQTLAQAGIGAYQPYLQTAASYAAPGAYTQFQSPYQQDVIQATMDEFDIQAQKGLPALRAQAIGQGAFGGGREGVQLAEYQSASDRNRAALLAQLNQQGFANAQNLRQQALQNQLTLAGQGQTFLGQDVGALSTMGALNQAQAQAGLGAQQQLAQQQLQQPLTAAQTYGSGVTSLIAGYPGQTQTMTAPSPNPLATALGAGTTLAGIYRAFNPATQQIQIK